MTTVSDAVAVYQELDMTDRMAFYITLTGRFEINKQNIQDILLEIRFPDGILCPHCDSSHFVKNGVRPDGIQRYLCRDCRRSFLASTDSVISGTRKRLMTWQKYLCCMMDHNTLKESSEKCGISMGTAFHWRHKILDALQKTAGNVCLTGTVEADETYIPVSYKGNHSKSRSFTMPRPAHPRGGSVKTKGLSVEQVCVPCAVDVHGISLSGTGKPGKVSSDCIMKLFRGHIGKDAVLCTDHEKAYLRLAGEYRLKLVQMGTGRRTSGTYGIQRINAYHSRLKGFLRRLRGVSTRYLDNYLAWNDIMPCPGRNREETVKLLLKAMLVERKRTLCREISMRPPVPATA